LSINDNDFVNDDVSESWDFRNYLVFLEMLLSIPAFTDNDFNFAQNLLHWWEIILVPVYFFLFVKIGKYYYNKKFPQGTDQKLFINGLKVKMLGSIFITLIYNFYYLGGDTTAYFNDGRLLNRILFNDPVTAVRMFFISGNRGSWPDDLLTIVSNFRMPFAANTWIIVKIAAFFGLLCFQSMLCTSLFFAFFAYACLWRFYSTLGKMYPQLKKKLGVVIIFVPSVIIWGSGIFKDTVTLAAMLVLFCSVYTIFFERKKIIKNFLTIIISGYLLLIVKDYILFSFSVSILLWLLISVSFSIRARLLRIIVLLFITGIGILSFFAAINYIGTGITEFAVKALLENTVLTGQYLHAASTQSEGSTYDLGTIEPTIQGFIAAAPKAINVTLFRPYLWESNKIIILFSAIESSLIFLYFIYVLFKNKVIFFFTKILKDPYLILCVFFTLIFATFVGVSSFNFGSLVRYKIPCIPFFLTALVIIDGKRKRADKALSV
jgi:hypothetical protein